MNYIKISNQGAIEAEALTLLGASTKRGTDKIGMFGSGNKYALSYLIRNNYEIAIYSGEDKIEITTEEKSFRDTNFQIILINGEKTSITTEFGKDWELWQAIRELYCNALDEGEAAIEFVNSIIPEAGKTQFYIKNREEITSFISNFDTYFSDNRKVLFECEYGKILEKKGVELCFFRKGIRCFEGKSRSVYDYDFNNVHINESRIIIDSWGMSSKIWKLIYKCTNKEVIKNVLFKCAESDYIECISSSFASVSVSDMSDEYIEVLNELTLAPKGLSGLLTLEERGSVTVLPNYIFEQARSKISNENLASKFKVHKNGLYREIEPDEYQKAMLKKAFDFFKECNYPGPCNYPVILATFEEKKILGFADVDNQRTILSDICFDEGLQTVIEALIEEYIHLKYEVSDETRGFQHAAITELILTLKKKKCLYCITLNNLMMNLTQKPKIKVKFAWTELFKTGENESTVSATFKKVSTEIEELTLDEITEIHRRNYKSVGRSYSNIVYLMDNIGHCAHEMKTNALEEKVREDVVYEIELDYPWLRLSPIRSREQAMRTNQMILENGSLD